MASRLSRATRPLHCLSRITLARPTQQGCNFGGPIINFTRPKLMSSIKKMEIAAKKAAKVKHLELSNEARQRVVRTLFLSQIPKGVNASELKSWCEENGVYPWRILMPVQRFSLRNTGYAFIELGTVQDVRDAIFHLKSKFLRTSDVQTDRTQADPELLLRKYLSPMPQIFPHFDREYSVDDMLKPIREGRRVYVGRKKDRSHISPGQLRHNLLDLLSDFSVEAVSKFNMTSYEQFAFVDAATRESADIIIAELDKKEALDVRLRVERVQIEDPGHGWDAFIEIERIAKNNTTPITEENELSILPQHDEPSTSKDEDTSVPNPIETAMSEDTENPVPEESELSIPEDESTTIPEDEQNPVPPEAELSIIPDGETTGPQDEEVLTPKDGKTE